MNECTYFWDFHSEWSIDAINQVWGKSIHWVSHMNMKQREMFPKQKKIYRNYWSAWFLEWCKLCFPHSLYYGKDSYKYDIGEIYLPYLCTMFISWSKVRTALINVFGKNSIISVIHHFIPLSTLTNRFDNLVKNFPSVVGNFNEKACIVGIDLLDSSIRYEKLLLCIYKWSLLWIFA